MEIEKTLREVMDKIRNSAIKAGKDPDRIRLVTVSKTVEIERIMEAINAGATILGENRVQEAGKKIQDSKFKTQNYGVEWHLIGNLQKNKAKTAVDLFDLIHSVDSQGLAEELNKYAAKKGKIQRVLVQVKLSDEEAKHGLPEKDLMGLLEKVSTLDYLRLEGLMTMPPYFESPEETRPFFKRLRQIADKAKGKGLPVNELSMGMSHDFEVAIEEGSTMVRIGTAIFGERSH
jgi:pyridoxal phosphate enzyme (YggS family)